MIAYIDCLIFVTSPDGMKVNYEEGAAGTVLCRARSPPSMVGVTVLNDLFAELQRGFSGGHPPL